jgi:uncharacterized membrane protein (DUF485 family)
VTTDAKLGMAGGFTVGVLLGMGVIAVYWIYDSIHMDRATERLVALHQQSQNR